ncbi:MAG: alpha/beta hydrolase [Planctomycetes bacterium]|nr:alpha/beta hydrolase [Planctomycetota bacterium]
MRICPFLFTVPALAVLLLPCGCSSKDVSPPPPSAESFSCSTDDGWLISGSFFPAPPASAPASRVLLLLHMLGRDRSTMLPLVDAAVRSGIPCCSIDLRGHGESTSRNGSPSTVSAFSPGPDFLAMQNDVSAALGFLKDSKGFQSSQVVIIGASIGANVALLCASSDKSIPAVVLLSPGVVFRGVGTLTPAASYGSRPLMLVSAADDEYSASSVTRIVAAMPQANASVRSFDSGGHGTDLFRSQSALPGEIVDWILKLP